MWSKIFPKRFALLRAFVLIFLSISFLVRLSLLVWDFNEVDKGVLSLLRTFLTGFLFDIGTISFFTIPYLIYLILFPKKWYGSLADKILMNIGFILTFLIVYFSFFAEFTFWDEFHRRFNFIAVDYLIYTYEVVQNINESYPLPILISSILALVALTIFFLHRFGLFRETYQSTTFLGQKLVAAIPWFIIVLVFCLFVNNDRAEWSHNRYNNELSKAGIYSFFAAFRGNELSYTDFYKTIPEKEAFKRVKNGLSGTDDTFVHPRANEIFRAIKNTGTIASQERPNVIFICVESLSGAFLTFFGNDKNLTPHLDSIAKESIFLTNLYATGTRTVRGMEAITLSIPPTPGRSIVKRKNNTGLYTIGEVFKEKGYDRNFFYGGDGYFDNMNAFFGGNGFNIIDRGRGFLTEDAIKAKRINIEDNEVTFENAWGVCDEDILSKVIRESDKAHKTGKPFFDFVMTTSNHKPYTYPDGKIDIPSGTGRDGAVKYTDYAIGEFLRIARTKPWFKNTIFVIMSDHCSNSAGRWELDIQNYHIPALIYNPSNFRPQKIDKLCSQIDIFPTLFGLMGWNYNSNFFGTNILKMKPEDERAFVGNYRKLGLLKDNKVMVLGDQQATNFYKWNPIDNSLTSLPMNNSFLENTIAWYQVADYLYTHNDLKIENR